MQFAVPFIDVLVIPSGAGPTDDRIVIDGTTGRIEIYQGAFLVAFIDPDDGFVATDGSVFPAGEWSQMDAGTGQINVNNGHDHAGGMQATTTGGDPSLIIDSPIDDPFTTRARITLKGDGALSDSVSFGNSFGFPVSRLRLRTESLFCSDGANFPMGRSTLVAGTVTVNHTRVTANSRIFLSRHTAGGTLGHLSIGAITAATSFVINSSSATDTSSINWLMIEPD